MTRITPDSLPGMVREENRNRSPLLQLVPEIAPAGERGRGRAPLPLGAGDDQQEPVARDVEGVLRRDGVGGSRPGAPVSTPAVIMRFMARPMTQTERAGVAPGLGPAS